MHTNTKLPFLQSHLTEPSIEPLLPIALQRFLICRLFIYLAMYIVAGLGYEEETKAIQAYLDF